MLHNSCKIKILMQMVFCILSDPPPPLDNGKVVAETCRGEDELETKVK
jgi:hypothetical protein